MKKEESQKIKLKPLELCYLRRNEPKKLESGETMQQNKKERSNGLLYVLQKNGKELLMLRLTTLSFQTESATP